MQTVYIVLRFDKSTKRVECGGVFSSDREAQDAEMYHENKLIAEGVDYCSMRTAVLNVIPPYPG